MNYRKKYIYDKRVAMGNDNTKQLSRSSSNSSCAYIDSNYNDDSVNIFYTSNKCENKNDISSSNPLQIQYDEPKQNYANRSNSMKVNTNLGYK